MIHFYYLMLVIVFICSAGSGAIGRLYIDYMGSNVREGIIKNIISGLFASVIFFAASGFKIECTPYTLIMTIILGLINGANGIISLKIIGSSNMTTASIFSLLGGIVIPYIYGLFFLDEAVTLTKTIALLLIVVSVILPNIEKRDGKYSPKFILLCMALFIIPGLGCVGAKLHQIETRYAVASTESFSLLVNLMQFLFFAFMLPFFAKKTEPQKKLTPKVYIILFLSTAINSFANWLHLICAEYLPASVMFPIMNGGTLICTSLLDKICFKAKLSIQTKLSMIMCMTALVLFAI